MAIRHTTVAAVAAGLTLGALLAMPDALGQAADVPSPLTASTASVSLPTAHVPAQTTAATAAAMAATAAAAQPSATDPAATAEPLAALKPVGDVSGLTASGIPQTALDAYQHAAAGAPCSIDWSLLAAIGRVESNHGRYGGASLHTDGLSAPPVLGPALNGVGFALVPDTDGGALDGDATLDRAVGPMQFIPSTWALYGRDGNGDGRKDPFNIYDATAGAAAYLCRAGGDLSTVAGQARAVFAYNHSDTYVATVLNLAAAYAGTTPPVIPPTSEQLVPTPPVNPGPPPAVVAETPAVTPAAPTTDAPPTSAVIEAAPQTSLTPTETTTPPPSTAAALTTTPPATTTTTPPAETTTTPPAETTTPPAETTTPPAETTTPPATTTTTPPATTTTPTTTTPSCPALTVDVLNTTGDPAVATQANQYLQAPGVVVGTVTTTGTAATTSIEYPAAQQDQATQFAQAVGAPGLLVAADVPDVTVVLGPDNADLLAELKAFPGLTC